ncbi:MAG: hypothetical protein WC343_07185 [Bacilli bacterium]|jgi:hypothetical protein
MGRKSKIESHPKRNIIVKRLASGEEYPVIVRDFPDLTWDDLDYYKKKKLPEILSKSNDLKAEVESIHGTDTLAEIRELKTKALNILEEAQSAGDLKTALLGIREARGCLETCLRAEGQIKDGPQITIINNPEWIELRTLIIASLDPYPEAKAAMVNAIRDR